MRRPLATLAFAAALAAASASVASPALFAVAVGLVLLTAAAALAVGLAARRVTVARTIIEREVQEDASIRLRFSIRGTACLPVRLEVEDHAGGWMAIGEPDASLELSVARRGAHWLAPSRVRLRDAIGIFERQLLAGSAEPLLILPAPQGHAPVHAHRLATNDDLEPHGLQAYTPGTPRTRIHWPALARGAGLQVQRFAPSPGGLPLVVVDTAGASSAEAVDWVARTAAGYILTLARNGGCRVKLPGDASETSVTAVNGEWRAIHRRLATLGHSTASTTRLRAARELHIRAAAAPPGLTPSPRLPAGVLPRQP